MTPRGDYYVQVLGDHLIVERRSGGDRIGWDALQRMKSEAWGDDAVAIEVYPAESDVVNDRNRRHLWRVQGDVPNLKRR